MIITTDQHLQGGGHWAVECTNEWRNRGFKKIAICTERKAKIADPLISLANSMIRRHIC